MPAAKTAAPAYDLCVHYYPDRFPKERPWETSMKMVITLVPCSSFRARSRSRSPDNNGGALNLDIKATRATTSTTEDDEVSYERTSPPTAIESSELRGRLQETIHRKRVAESVASDAGPHWKRKRYDSTEARSPPIEVEHDSDEPHPLPNVIRKATHTDVLDLVAASASTVAVEQPMLLPKSNEQHPYIKNGHALPPFDPIALFNTRTLYPYWFPHQSLMTHFVHPATRAFAEEAASFQKDAPNDLSRIDPSSHPHQSSAAVASIH